MARAPRAVRATASAAVVLCVLGLTAACGGSDSDAADGADQDPKVIDITFDGDSVTPNGDRVEVGVGQPIDLEITADQPGEIHIHSDPEQEIEYDAGSTTKELVIDRPGIVEVESHTLDEQIVSLQVQ